MSLEFVDQGSLVRPGPIGRLLRLLLGGLCLYGLWELILAAPYYIYAPISLLPNMALMVLVFLCVFNYVVNIGFGKDWGRYPLILSLTLFGLIALGNYLATGNAQSPLLGIVVTLWLCYFFAHLGLSFVLAALLATPGCEMRAIPELFGRITKQPAREHHCPASIISGIDRWERDRAKR